MPKQDLDISISKLNLAVEYAAAYLKLSKVDGVALFCEYCKWKYIQ
jgi:hypothetical protein